MVKFLTFSPKNASQSYVGILSDNKLSVEILYHPNTKEPITNFFQVIEQWPLFQHNLNPTIAADPESFSLKEVVFTAPLPGRDVMAVGKNYPEHAKEFNKSGYDSSDKNDIPDFPVIFTKRATSIVAHESEIYPHPNMTKTLDYEGELGVIIGKSGHSITKEEAMDYVWGYTIINDVTARERQRDHKQFFIGKSLDTFCPIGPYMVPASDVQGDQLRLETKVNGELRQKGNTKDLIFDIPTLLSTISQGITIQPGDLIATGTPAGVGFGFDPPKFLQPGDIVEVCIEGIGVLRNKVSELDAPRPTVEPVRLSSYQTPYPKECDLIRLPIEGQLMHVEEKGRIGSKNVALFIHGLGGNLHFFDAIIELAGLHETHHIIQFDWEGHGLSPVSDLKKVTIDTIINDILQLLYALNIPNEKVLTVFGHSMGGLIAATLASRNLNLIKSLILIGPVKALGQAGKDAMQSRANLVRDKGMSAVVETICQGSLSEKTRKSSPLSVSFVRQSIMSTNVEGYARACEALKEAIDPDYEAIDVPTLIISSDQDKTAPPANIDHLTSLLPKVELQQLHDIGHWHAVEDPEAVGKAVKEFIK